jgi:hypothetical protein
MVTMLCNMPMKFTNNRCVSGGEVHRALFQCTYLVYSGYPNRDIAFHQLEYGGH